MYFCAEILIHNILRFMAKYNITEKKEKEAAYRTLVNTKMMDEMKEKKIDINEKKKKDKEKD